MAEPQTDPNTPLSDEYLKAHANDPEVAPFLNSEERRRLSRIRVDSAKAAGGPMMGPAPPSRWQNFVSQVTDAMGPPTPKGELPPNPIGPQARAFANTPLVRPTGIDLIDSFTSPLSLGLAGVGMAGKVAGALRPAVGAAVDTVRGANIGPELKSLALGHRGEKALSIAEKLRGAMSEAAPATAPEVGPPSARTPGATPTPSPSPAPAARPTPPVARTLPPEDPAVAEIVDRMAGGKNKPSPGNGTYREAGERAKAANQTAVKSARQTFDLKSMTPEEQTQAAKWLAENVPADVIIKRIQDSRAMTGKFNTPNPEEAAATTKARVAEAAKRRKSGVPDEEP